MPRQSTRRRPYGTGSLKQRPNADGSSTWLAQWRDSAGHNHRRALGRVRTASHDGLTQREAEDKLRELRSQTPAVQRVQGARPDVAQVAAAYLARAERRGRKPSTQQNIESEVRLHIRPFFGARPMDPISVQDVEDSSASRRQGPRAQEHPEHRRDPVGSIHVRQGAAPAMGEPNPCEGVELPAVPDAIEIRFLTLAEVRLLIDHAPPGPFQALDRAV